MLDDNAGVPITGTHNFALTLYDGAGTNLWSESQTGVNVTKGVFFVRLGSVHAFPPSLDFSKPYLLGVSIDGGAELPRTQLSSAPYSLHSAIADALSSTATGAVTSLNGLAGSVQLQGAGGTTVTPNGNVITISSSGGGGTGIQGVQSLDGSLAITSPNGPTANIQLPAGGIPLSKISTSGAMAGQTLTYNGSALTYAASTLSLPYGAIDSGSATSFAINQRGTGHVAEFKNLDTSSNSLSALYGEANNNGASVLVSGVYGKSANGFGIIGTGGQSSSGILGFISNGSSGVPYNAGSGVVGFSNVGNGMTAISYATGAAGIAVSSSSGPGILASSGSAKAGSFSIYNTANANPALEAASAGTGVGINGTSAGSAGIRAAYTGAGSGVALEVSNGAIKVTGGNPGAFIHTATLLNITGNYTTITNTLTDGDPTAMLQVTPLYSMATPVYCNFPIGVFYIPATGHWAIFNQNGGGSMMPVNALFNVLVIKH